MTYEPHPSQFSAEYERPISPRSLRRAAAFFGLVAVVLALSILPLVARGQTPDPGADPSSFLLEIVKAVQGGDWRGLAVLVAVLVTWGAKAYGAKAWPFLGTARGGALLALVLGIAGTLIPAAAGGAPFTLKLCIDAVLFGLTSIGGWVGVRRIVWGDVSAAVAKEAAATVIPLGTRTTTKELGAELDKPVK